MFFRGAFYSCMNCSHVVHFEPRTKSLRVFCIIFSGFLLILASDSWENLMALYICSSSSLLLLLKLLLLLLLYIEHLLFWVIGSTVLGRVYGHVYGNAILTSKKQH